MIFAQFPVKKEQLKINFISINTINVQDFQELYLEILNEVSTKIWSVRGREGGGVLPNEHFIS